MPTPQANQKFKIWLTGAFLGLVTLLLLFYFFRPANPSVNTPVTDVSGNAIETELMLDVDTLPEVLRPVRERWQGYVSRIKQGAAETLTYARNIELALSTVGENTWFIQSEAGIYEDAQQSKVLMRDVTGHLEKVNESATASKKSGQAAHPIQLELKAPFAYYDATQERIDLQGRSRIILHQS